MTYDYESIKDTLALIREELATGVLTDATRMQIHQLALSMCGNELYRIEKRNPGSVNQELLQAILMLGKLVESDLMEPDADVQQNDEQNSG